MSVVKALAVSQVCGVRCNIGAGCSHCGGFGTVSGGLSPYTYRLAAGSVPTGMSLGGLAVGGKFPQGAYSLAVVVTDQLGAQATVHATWSIYGAGVLRAGAACSDFSSGACSASGWSYSSGSPVAPKVVVTRISQYCSATGCSPVPTGLPPGWNVSAKGGTVHITAGPIACNAPGYQGVITLALVDTAACATTSQSNPADLVVNISNGC